MRLLKVLLVFVVLISATSCQKPEYTLEVSISKVNYIFFGSRPDPFGGGEDLEGPGVDLRNVRVKWNRKGVSVRVIKLSFTFYRVPPSYQDYTCSLEDDDIALYLGKAALDGSEDEDGIPEDPWSIYCIGLDLGDDPFAFVSSAEVEVVGVYTIDDQPRVVKGYQRFSIQNLN